MRVTSKLFNKILYIKCLKNIYYKQYNLKNSSLITKLTRREKNYSDYVKDVNNLVIYKKIACVKSNYTYILGKTIRYIYIYI